MINILTVAKSVRIFLKKEEEAFYRESINGMILWFDSIYEVKSKEFVYSTVSEEKSFNDFDDEPKKEETISTVLSNAPAVMENFIIVPKVI